MAKKYKTPRSASSPTAGRRGFIMYIWTAHHKQYKQAMIRMSSNDSCDFFFVESDEFTLHGLAGERICQNYVVPTTCNLTINMK